jgi:hypothetical protein
MDPWFLHLLPAPLSLIAAAWPLLMLCCCLPFCLSWASHLAGCCITSLLSSWLLHCLFSRRHLPSAGASTSHCAVASHHALLHSIASPASSSADCCITSTHTIASDLPASPPLILVAPWPLMLLVRLVVASPLLTLLPPICWHLHLSLHHCLLSYHGLLCLLYGWLLHCLCRSSSRCVPASGCATSTSHLPFAFCLPWLVVMLLLVALPLPPILLTCNRLSMRWLIVAMHLVALPLQLIFLARCCPLMRCLHLPIPFDYPLPWLVVASLLVAPPHPLSLHAAASQRTGCSAAPFLHRLCNSSY